MRTMSQFPAMKNPSTAPWVFGKVGCLVLVGLAAVSEPAWSQVKVDAIVTPLVGSFRYDISVHNNAAEDLAIVSLVDAPLADPLIDLTLAAPVGFLASYDDGLGFVDFLGDADVFAAGATVGGFGFESLTAPGAYFASFEALGVLGTSYSGSLRSVMVPEAGTLLAAVSVVGCALIQVVRRVRQCR